MSGKLIIVSAPSGAGKTTIVKHLLDQSLNLEFSISATSRDKRHTEIHGKDYYFFPPVDFKNNIKEEAFLEWEEVYEDKFYGTLKSEVDRITKKGGNVIFDVDVVGGLNIKKLYGEQALSIFIDPPSIKELENRLKGRATDDAETIAKRVEKAEYEIGFKAKFDVIIINDTLQKACDEMIDTVSKFIQ